MLKIGVWNVQGVNNMENKITKLYKKLYIKYLTFLYMLTTQFKNDLAEYNNNFGNTDVVWPLYRRTDTYRTKYGYWLRMRVNSIMVSNNITIDYRSYDWGESIVIYQNGTLVTEVFEYTKEKNKDYTKYEKLYFFIKSKYK